MGKAQTLGHEGCRDSQLSPASVEPDPGVVVFSGQRCDCLLGVRHDLCCSANGQTLIEKRTSKDIWQNMFQFPLRETRDEYVDIPENWAKFKVRESAEIIHILSHQKIHAKFHHFSVLLPDLNEDTLIIEWDKIQDYPLPRLVDRYLDEEDFT